MAKWKAGKRGRPPKGSDAKREKHMERCVRVIRKCSTLGEVAEKLGVSRPTAAKYAKAAGVSFKRGRPKV